jgi:hypothetical protein
MSRSSIVLLTVCLCCGASTALAQASPDEDSQNMGVDTSIVSPVDSTLPDSPAHYGQRFDPTIRNSTQTQHQLQGETSLTLVHRRPSGGALSLEGLLLQSFAFMMLEDTSSHHECQWCASDASGAGATFCVSALISCASYNWQDDGADDFQKCGAAVDTRGELCTASDAYRLSAGQDQCAWCGPSSGDRAANYRVEWECRADRAVCDFSDSDA